MRRHGGWAIACFYDIEQKVLEYREARKNLDASKLSQSKNKLVDEQNKLDHIEEEKDKVIQDDSENESVSIHHLLVSSDYIVQLNDNMEKQVKKPTLWPHNK